MATFNKENRHAIESSKLELIKKYSYLLIVVILGFFPRITHSQITADFIVSQDSGCVPFIADFLDVSSGNIVYRHWDFGNGNIAVGNNSTPSAVYNSSGTYDVTLTIYDGHDTATITKTAVVTVFDNPVADFIQQSTLTGCAVFPFQVSNNSISGTLPIVSYEWDFDDGSLIDTGQSITHNYYGPGTYNVTLIVKDSLGCSSSKVKHNLVTVNPKPKANFYSNDSLSVCGPPHTVTLLNSSTSSHPMSFIWNVDGTVYNSLNVNSTFTQSGGYDVELIVTNSIGCSDTLFQPNYIWIGAIQAQMDIEDTVCIGIEYEYRNSSFGGSEFNWDFGTGGADTGDTVVYAYNVPGMQNVTLVASSGSTCDDTLTQSIYVEEVHADFISNPHTACQVPLVVSYTDQSIGNIKKWQWRFGNLIGPPGRKRPNITGIQNPNNTFWEAGTFDDTLIVTSFNGCIDSLIVPINEEIIITQAAWTSDISDGCFPLEVNFTNSTDSVNRMATWWWDFDDGSPIDYALNPSHTFTNVGEYLVSLSVVSIDGCTTSYSSEIRVGSVQNAQFSIDTNFSCASDSVFFNNYSSDTNLINAYVWLFGDGKSSGDFEPGHLYLDTGYLEVSLIAVYNGCGDTLTIDSAIRIGGPIVDFYPTYNCDDKNIVQFNPIVTGGTNWIWDFGDSSALDSSNWVPTHNYPAKDSNYTATLTMWDSISGCTQTNDEDIRIRYLVGRISCSDTTACRNDQVIFNTGNSSNAITYVRWSLNGFSNQKIDNANTAYYFPTKGPHTVYAIVMDEHGCLDTTSQDLVVYEPIVDFDFSPISSCAPATVQFTDLSRSDTLLHKWAWDFGNGSGSTLQNPSYVYNDDGTVNFDVTLTVTDTFGCVNVLDSINAVLVIEPPSFFDSDSVKICEFQNVTFFDQPIGNYSYWWNFGDGTSSNSMSPLHQYTQPGFYDISLTISDSNGCDSTFIRPNFIEVQDTPEANFIGFPTSTDCFPSSIIFGDLSIYQNAATWTWNFGDSPNNVVLGSAGAQNLYNQPGFYDVTLILTTTYGCADTTTKYNYIHVGGPTGVINHHPEIGCVDQDVVFSIDSTNSDSERFIWDFGDGVVDTTYSPNFSINHVYNTSGFFNVTVFISDALGLCQITDTLDIEISEVRSNFIISDTAGCNPLSFDVQNNSIGDDTIQWLLNGNLYSQFQVDSFFITNSGVHEVSLIVLNNYSQCRDTSMVKVLVHPNPDIIVNPNLTICIGDTVELNATGANSYSWSPFVYLNDTTIHNPICIPDTDMVYYVHGVDTNNCEGFDSVLVNVQQKPELLWITPDTSIFIGTELQLNTISSLPVIYSWTPDRKVGCADCPDPWVKPNDTTVFTLVYQDEYGCFIMDTTVTINVMDEFKVTIPNTFTPGTDALNDTFAPVIYGVEELMFMRIFDRWGTMVYETNDITQGWDGTYKGEIAAHNSAFSYTVRVRRYNGELKDYVGVVIVLTNGL